MISFSSSSSIPSGNRVLPVAVDTSSSTSVRWKVGPLFKRRRSSTNRQSQAQQETIDRDIAAEKTTHSVESSTIKALEQEEHNNKVNVSAIQEDIKAEVEENQQTPVETNLDSTFMQAALEMAQGTENTGGVSSPYPQPVVGAVLVATDGKILGKGRSDHNSEAVQNCIKDAGIEATALSEWCIAWPANPTLRNALKNATLYITLEPSPLRQGTAQPSITSLIRETGISRVVIGCCHPIHDLATKGAAALHAAGITVSMIGGELEQQCSQVLEEYAILQNNKLMCQARKHAQIFGRPLGFLHCRYVSLSANYIFTVTTIFSNTLFLPIVLWIQITWKPSLDTAMHLERTLRARTWAFETLVATKLRHLLRYEGAGNVQSRNPRHIITNTTDSSMLSCRLFGWIQWKKKWKTTLLLTLTLKTSTSIICRVPR